MDDRKILQTDWDEPAALDQNAADWEFLRVKQGLRKHHAVSVVISILLVFTILTATLLYVLPTMEKRYQNPEEKNYSNDFSDMEFTLRTFSELFVPNQNVCDVKSVKTGFAEYDLSVTFRQLRNRNQYISRDAVMERGRLSVQAGMWEFPEEQDFYLDTASEGAYYFSTAEKSLEKLPDYVKVLAYITFPEDLSVDEFMMLLRRVGSAELEIPGLINWIGIRAQKDGQDIYPLCGMKPFYANDGEQLGRINEYYPAYSIYGMDRPVDTASAVKEHFKSLLQYSIDQQKEGKGILPEGELAGTYYETVMEYINTNGIYVYGCSMTAAPAQLLELLRDGTVCAVSIQDVWIAF